MRRHHHFYGPYFERLRQPGLRDDAEIKQAVEAALAEDDDLDTRRITVTVAQGIVTLRGIVDTATEKRAAGDDAWEVWGVRDVRNELRIGRQSGRSE